MDTSRAEAIERGLLIDITAAAEDAGVAYPVAVSRAAWTATGAELVQELMTQLARRLRSSASAAIYLDVSGARLVAAFESGDEREPVITIRTGGERWR